MKQANRIPDRGEPLPTDQLTQTIYDLTRQALWAVDQGDDQAGRLSAEAFALLDSQTTIGVAQSVVGDLHAVQAYTKFKQNDFEGGLREGAKAIALYRLHGWGEGGALALGAVANLYMEIGDYAAALDLSTEQLAVARQWEKAISEAAAHQRIGIIYSQMGRYEDAIAQYDKAMAIYIREGEIGRQAGLYNNYCVEYTNLGDLENALNNAEKSLELFEQSGSLPGQIRIQTNLSTIYVKRDRFEPALHHAEKALAIAKNLESQESLAYALVALGQVYNHFDHPEEAIGHLQEALKTAETIGSSWNQLRAHEELSKTYKKSNQFELALRHFELFHSRQAEIFNEERTSRFQRLDVLHRTRQAQQDALHERELRQMAEAQIQDLESFSFSAAHDLRAPLRRMEGLINLLREEYPDELSDAGARYFTLITRSARMMNELIAGLLRLSRVSHANLKKETFDLSILADDVYRKLVRNHRERRISWSTKSPIAVEGDQELLEILMENLIANALKFTSKLNYAEISLGTVPGNSNRTEIFIRDNGAGFDMAYAAKLFQPFDRLHSEEEFEGNGIGLAIVKRIIEKHGGTIRADGVEGEGATFYFTLV